ELVGVAWQAMLDVAEGHAVTALFQHQSRKRSRSLSLADTRHDLAVVEALPCPPRNRGRLADEDQLLGRLHHARSYDRLSAIHEFGFRPGRHDRQVVAYGHAHALLLT